MKLYAVSFDSVTRLFRNLFGQFPDVQRDIEEFPAGVAPEMSMYGPLGVESILIARGFDSLGFALVDEDVQVPVNGSETRGRVSVFNYAVDILGRRVFPGGFEILQDSVSNPAFSVFYGLRGLNGNSSYRFCIISYAIARSNESGRFLGVPPTNILHEKEGEFASCIAYTDPMATLYVVATPIGNLEDITYRAIRILGEVPVIAAEDTRQTRKLLDRYAITPESLISCRARNEEASSKGIVMLLDRGKDVAYASDAGTPGVSDPGSRLAAAAREAGHNVVPLPGASAVTALVSVAGVPGKGFVFEGFLSPKAGRRRRSLEELLSLEKMFVLYESPFRILKLLEDLKELAPARKILLGREITKKFEEFITGTADEALAALESRGTLKGEFALLVGAG